MICKRSLITGLAFSWLVFLMGCQSKGPDLRDIQPDFEWIRFDSVMAVTTPEQVSQKIPQWRQDYGFLLDNPEPDSVLAVSIGDFLRNPMVAEVFKEVKNEFADLSSVRAELNLAFRHLLYYFPASEIPRIYTYVSGLDYTYPIKYSDSAMALALDMYLGSDFLPYRTLGLPLYKQRWFVKECLVRDCMEEIYLSKHSQISRAGILLDYMVDAGKKYCFMAAAMPDLADTTLLRFSTGQLEWCKKNEANIWAFLLEQDLLFSGDRERIAKFVQDGPFTPGFDEASPGRLADYIGWKMIKSYQARNPNLHLADLMGMKNPRALLEASGYKP